MHEWIKSLAVVWMWFTNALIVLVSAGMLLTGTEYAGWWLLTLVVNLLACVLGWPYFREASRYQAGR